MAERHRHVRRLLRIHPLLFAALPVLFLYAHNAGQLQLEQLLRPLLAACGFALSTWVVLAVFLRSIRIAAVVASVLVTLVFSFGHAVDWLAAAGMPLQTARGVIAVTSSAVLFMLIWRGARQRHRLDAWETAQAPLAVVATILVLVQVARIARVETSASGELPIPSRSAPHVDDDLPDIYCILLDGYGRNDVLRDLYDFDNGEFLASLRDMGFHVADRSYANYVGTLWTLASLLHMDYVQNLAALDPRSTDVNALIQLIRSSRVVHELRQRGYHIVSLSSGYASAELGRVDTYLEPPRAMNDFEAMLLGTTPLRFVTGSQLDAHDAHRNRLRWMLETLPRLPDTPGPRFVFAHLLAPHPPFVLDRNGKALPTPEVFALNDGSHYYWLGGSEEEYRRLYAEQTRWVTQQIERSLRQLLADAEKPPIVVLLSDHGPGSQLDCDQLGDTNLHERFAVLHALHLPQRPGLTIPADLSLVNTFRLVFDLYFGTELGRLPFRAYYTSAPVPFDFIDVTASLPR